MPLKLAITVDDLFEWVGSARFEESQSLKNARRLTDAFASHSIKDVYAFSNTAPADDDPTLYRVFDHWSERGHHVGNHTHQHASLNWVTPTHYISDIERTEALIAPWSNLAPFRTFRHCFDMWGDTSAKRDEVVEWLLRAGYRIAPISLWFYDGQFSLAYTRALIARDETAQAWLRERFVETAVNQLQLQAAAAQLIFGRDPIHIWLIHGTPIAAACIAAILDRFAEAGVVFVDLEEALADPMNQRQPIVTAKFRNQVQKWAEWKGVAIEDCPPAILSDLEQVCPRPGVSEPEVMEKMMLRLTRSMGMPPVQAGFSIN